jgi:hypothetical protein
MRYAEIMIAIRHRRVIARVDVWSNSELLLRAGLLAIAVIFVAVVTVGGLSRWTALPPGSAAAASAALFGLCLPLWVMGRYRFQLETPRRTIFAGAGFGAGLSLAGQPLILKLLVQGQLGLGITAEAGCVIVIAISIAITRLAWTWLSSMEPTVWIQDGTRCPSCGYCVRGVASKVCSECGRSFNSHELAS